jgi:hypothetical protein
MVMRVKQNILKRRNEIISETNAIVLIGFNRPEMLNQRLIDLKDLRNRKIYISIDFESTETIEKTRIAIASALTELSKNNTVSVNYHNMNLGLTEHVTMVVTNALRNHDNVIVIEDDIELNDQTIYSLDFGLELMNCDSSIGSVGAFSPINLPKVLKGRNSFHKSKYFACWGWATSRAKWDNYRADLGEEDLLKSLNNSRIWSKLSKKAKVTWLGRFRKVQLNPSHTWDIQFQYISFKNGWTHLVPYGSLVGNTGFSDERGEHTKGPQPKWMREPNLPSRPIQRLSKGVFFRGLAELIASLTFIGDEDNYVKLLRKIKTQFKSAKIS